MTKVTKYVKPDKRVVQAKTTDKIQFSTMGYKWWEAKNDKDLANQVIETVSYLKQQQQYRFRQASIYARLYGNQPLYTLAGSTLSTTKQALPLDRPTMNVVQSCIDTLVSRITQSRPRPVFLTDNGDYKERKLAKQMNAFINGEIYQTHAYALGELVLRDAAMLGTGCVKIIETDDHRIGLERRLCTEVFVDPNDAFYGDPRQMFEARLVDRSVLQELFPKYAADIADAQQAFPDNSSEYSKSISDQVLVAEAWHLPSSKDSNDGLHALVCGNGVILNDEYKKQRFPFEFLHYSPRPVGLWAQGLAEQLMGTQTQINQMLITASRSINLMGVPRIWLEKGAKINKAHFNNDIGMIGEYSGSLPTIMEGNTGLTPDYYAHLQRLIEYAYQQSGISALSATSQKPAGLNSGEAIRSYDDLQSDRFAALAKRYDNLYVGLAYQICDKAMEIAKEQGSYQTVYPNKNGTKEINLPDIKHLDDPFVIQCFDASSLPRDPAGRLQKITEMMQANLVSPSEGRRLLDFPDIEQVDKLASAAEERILQVLDDIVEEGKYTPPDPFMDLEKANELVVQYYNLYVPAKLEPKRQKLLRDFFTQVQALVAASQPPPPPPQMPTPTLGVPQPPPVSDQLPITQ